MVNQLLIINKVSLYCNSCIVNDTKEGVLLLMNPQIIYFLEDSNKKSAQNLNDLNASFQNIEEVDNNDSFSTKFDKKHKSSMKIVDPLEIKKTKLKSRKKIRNKVHLEHDEIFIDKNKNLHSDADSLRMSLMRPINSIKPKKKNRLKVESNSNQVSSIFNELDKESSNISAYNKEIILENPLTIQELSDKLKIPAAEIITWLFLKGISVTINQMVDISIATEVAQNYKFTIISSSVIKKEKIKLNTGLKRPPIITIFGHVDHGKTTLLDTIRQTNLTNHEVGGITQAIAGYEVQWKKNSIYETLVFLDTPGHEAFSSMRNRGAQVTDIAILVIAADDGLKPQSIEAIHHILDRQIPFIVAINKIDKEGSNIDKLKKDLAEYKILGEDWGGKIPIIEISALKGTNIDVLLSSLCTLSELQEFKADPDQLAEGTILESHLDKNKGPVANVLIHNGTLRVGDIIISENIVGKVKVIINSNHKVNSAGPSSVIEVWGFSSIPNAGSICKVLKNEKEAKQIAAQYINQNDSVIKSLNSRVTLDSYINKSDLKKINVILKTDTQGSIEAIIAAFSQIPQEKVQINILSASSGEIAYKDIELALTSNSIILGFNVNLSSSTRNMTEKSEITIKCFSIIYDLINYIQEYMLQLVDLEYNKIVIGNAVVQTVFSVNKGSVAGCLVNSGKLRKKSYISIYRNKILVYDGMLSSLKRLKDDVDEINAISECGVMCDDYHLWEKLDFIEAYELNQKEKTL